MTNDMENYKWKQCVGLKKLHAIRELVGINKGISVTICRIPKVSEYISPETTQIKCKNCERKK